MRIAFCCHDTDAAPWLAGLRAQLPQDEVAEWQPGAPPADYAVVWHPPQAFLDEQPQLKAIFNIGAGVDALMRLRMPPQALLVRIGDGGMAVQMAEFVSHAVIRHFREMQRYEDEMRVQGQWRFRHTPVRAEYPVGVMGLGALGERVARTLLAFDFTVLGWSRGAKSIPGVQCFAGPTQFDAFLRATRILVCLLPLTPDTQGIMNRESLSKLRPGGYVINIARGAHLVEEDLLALLDCGQLAGAALDVFRTEPLPEGHPFWNHPKIVATPHMSARTMRDESIAQIAGKISALRRGEPIAGVVDLKRGY